jgi:hypothetical protein
LVRCEISRRSNCAKVRVSSGFGLGPFIIAERGWRWCILPRAEGA